MINKAKEFIGIGVSGKLKLMDYYNKNCYPYIQPNRKYKIKPNDEWCAMFTSVIAHMCGLKPEKFPYEVSVFQQRKWAISKGLYYNDTSKIKPNDLIIYDWKNNNTYDHVGIVVGVQDGIVKVIEGNKNDTVGYRYVSINSAEVDGYISIHYDGGSDNEVGELPLLDGDRIAVKALRTVTGVYGNGIERKAKLGADYEQVQRLINLM